MINDLFDEMTKLFDEELFTGFDKYSVPSFPPVKVVKRDNKVTFKFALAGYSKNDLDISFGKDCLILSTTEQYNDKIGKEFAALCSDDKDKRPKAKVLVNTLKDSSFSYKYFVPEDKFDFDKATAEFKDGILTIVVPSMEKEKEKEIKKIEIK